MWYKEKADVRLQGDVLFKLDTLLKETMQSSSASKIHALPPAELSLSCDSDSCNEYGCTSAFTIGKTGITASIDTDVIFAPEQFNAQNLITWSQSFAMPFKITNVLYITTKEYEYVIVQPSNNRDFSQELFSKIKESGSIKVTLIDSLSSFTEIPNIRYRYVVFDDADFTALAHQDTSVIKIDGNADGGAVQFREGDTVAYVDMTSLLGAVFSGNSQIYTCTMQKAIAKIQLVSSVYLKKAQKLKDYYNSATSPRPSCAFYYGDNTQDILNSFMGTTDLTMLSTYHEAITTLQHINEKALRSCRELY